MNPKKPFYSHSGIEREVSALRAEEPREEAIDQAVLAMRALPRPDRKNPVRSTVWRVALPVAAAVAMTVVFTARPQVASAADLKRISQAVRDQKTRYMKGYRPNQSGELKLMLEMWMEDVKHMEHFREPDGTESIHGYDGKRMFLYGTIDGGGFIDDVDPASFPREDIDDYLNIPGGSLDRVDRGVLLDGKKVDLYALSFSNVKFDLYVEPSSGLPVRRDVFTVQDRLIERDIYEYPADIPDAQFQPPASIKDGLCNYPDQRTVFAKQLASAGQTKSLGGVKITLRAVIVGKRQVVALWTGGAKTDFDAKGHIVVEGLPRGFAPGFETGSVWPSNDPDHPPLFVGKLPVVADGVWYEKELNLKKPIKISIPVWVEDRTRPLVSQEGQKLPGYHSKLIGSLSFTVDNPIYVQDAGRLIWRPGHSGEAKVAHAGK